MQKGANREEAPRLPQWIEQMLPAGVERYLLTVGAHRMHVMEIGQGRPVLLLHGNPTWGFLYRKVVSELGSEPFRLVFPDLIGLGFSDKPRLASAHRLADHAGWVGSLIDNLELEDIVFVGQDWGGSIGLRALAERPGVATAMVILNTVVGPPRPGFRPTAFHRLSQLPLLSDLIFRAAGFPQNVLGWAQGDRKTITGEVARAYRYPLRSVLDRAGPLGLARMSPDSMEHASVPELERCKEMVDDFGGPVEIVWGDRDPILGRLRKRIERAFPDARVTATQAGHFLQEEVPREIADAIRRVGADE